MLLAAFWEFIGTPENLGILAGSLTPLAIVIALCWASVEKTRSNNALKRDMLARGMSAEEIKQVMSRKPRGQCCDTDRGR